ncbi:MAG: metallophosphoesterase [Ilumatobacteraceae bacterium]
MIDVDRDIGAITVTGLEPSTTHDLVVNGRTLRTFTTATRPAGHLLGRVATLSRSPTSARSPSATGPGCGRGAAPTNGDAHPIWCLEAAADEVEQWAPDLLVVKGDLAHNNLPGEYDAVAKVLSGIGRPVLGMPGNHDGGHVQRSDFAAEIGRVGLGPADPVIVHDLATPG